MTDISANTITPESGGDPSAAATFRGRLIFVMVVFAIGFAVIGARLLDFGILKPGGATIVGSTRSNTPIPRPNILDRHGKILATDIQTSSLFADTKKMIDVDEAVEMLSPILPDVDAVELRRKLQKKRAFVWIQRELSPRQRADIHELGVPGIGFVRESRRVYPTGRAAAHILGHVNVDNQGIAGIETHIDKLMKNAGVGGPGPRRAPMQLALDLRVQHALRDELEKGITRFRAKAAAGVVLDVETGEVIALGSLPDYNPNRPSGALEKKRANRLVAGVYELGSTFKVVTTAMALDLGQANFETRYDARAPLKFGRFTIHDFHAQKRVLTLPEVFIHSSNIGTARMAMAAGVERHKAFLKKLGLLDRLRTELPESAKPLFPRNWRNLNSMTIAFGHGLSVAPLQLAAAGAALVNGGLYIPPTFLKRDRVAAVQLARRVVKRKTSDQIRDLMALNVNKGTARRAKVEGLRVGGKTGTAEKVVKGRYSKTALLTSFLGTFPTDSPRYLLLIMFDEPKPSKATHGYATSGWNAVPVAGQIISRIGPILGILPKPAPATPVVN